MNLWLISITAALDISYILPIAARRIFANHPEVQFKPGPFYMKGALGWAANIICISWTLFICVILSLPTDLPTNAKLFNYVRDVSFGYLDTEAHQSSRPHRSLAPLCCSVACGTLVARARCTRDRLARKTTILTSSSKPLFRRKHMTTLSREHRPHKGFRIPSCIDST